MVTRALPVRSCFNVSEARARAGLMFDLLLQQLHFIRREVEQSIDPVVQFD